MSEHNTMNNLDEFFLKEFRLIHSDAAQERAESHRRVIAYERLLARADQTDEEAYNRLVRKLYAEQARYYQLTDQIRDLEYHISELEKRVHRDN